jgi:hypothetical protein
VQHLLEEALQRGQMPLAKIRNRTKVWFVPGREHAEGHVLNQPALNSPRREDADTLGAC